MKERRTNGKREPQREREMEENLKRIFSELDWCHVTTLLRIRVIFYITGCVHTHTDMCHMETSLAPQVGAGDAQQP